MKNKEKYNLHNVKIVKKGSVPEGTGTYVISDFVAKKRLATIYRGSGLSMSMALLDWLELDYADMLTEKEHESLQFLYDHIRPRIEYFHLFTYGNSQCLGIESKGVYNLSLPPFETGTKYIGMEPNVGYKPEELGLTEKEDSADDYG